MCRYLILFVFLAIACTTEVVIDPTPETSTNVSTMVTQPEPRIATVARSHIWGY